MAIDITEPLSWKKADSEELLMLQGLQGNILKGHGRHFTANLFFRLDPARSLEARRLLRELANFHIVSAYRQLIDADTFKKAGKKRDGGRGAGAFVHVALSAAGYEAIGRGEVAPANPDFALGMGHPENLATLPDPSIENWER
ncbi:MAG: peroxidase, partial [Methylobacteriaceae bacterium]